MTASSPLRRTVLLGQLLALPDARRESLGAIRIQHTPAGTRGYLYSLSLSVPVLSITVPVPADGVEEEIESIRACGLFGEVTVARPEPGVWQVRLWSGSTQQRETWERRVLAAEKDEAAAALLAAAGRTRVLSWEREQASARLHLAVVAAAAAGLPRTRIAELAAVPRQRVYDILGAEQTTVGPLFEFPDPQPDPAPPAAAARPAFAGTAPAAAPARVRPAGPARDGELVALPRGHTVPCVVCRTAATDTLGGVGVHRAECLRSYREQLAAAGTFRPASHGPAPVQPDPGELAPAVTAGASHARGRGRAEGERFTGPAAAVDAEHVWLPGAQRQPWAGASHLGQVAMLVDTHRLGWGGGEDRRPDEGQIWLYPGAVDRLGLPVDLGLGPLRPDGLPWTQEQWEKAKREVFTRITGLPAVQEALADGWQLGQGGRVDVWTRIWHPQLLRSGARLVILPWNRVAGVSLMADRIDSDEDEQVVYRDTTPGELVTRLEEFARLVGVSYRLSPATTGLDLIDRCRPPRRSRDDPIGHGRGRVALVRNQPAELPDTLVDGRGRFANIERDYHWWRPWTSVTDSEKDRELVVMFDRGASYLTPWTSITVGVEGLEHRTGPDAGWDGTEAPGFYLVDRWQWADWWLPDPLEAVGVFDGPDKVWVTVHTLRQLTARDLTPVVHEAYTWQVSARYLEQPGHILRRARQHASAHILPTIKSVYSSTVGKLGANEHPPAYHLWRPDWRALIIAATRTAIQHTLTQVQATSGALPLVADTDLIAFALNEPRWPGPPGKEGTGPGQWKLVAAAPLDQWGPQFLPARPGRFVYRKALDAARDADVRERG